MPSVLDLHALKNFINGTKMNPLQEFAASRAEGYAQTTRQVYLRAATRGVKLAGKTPEDCGTYEELLGLLRKELAEKRLPKGLRIVPFLRFLQTKLPKTSENGGRPIRAWVADRLREETNAWRTPSLYIRRDLAMLAGLCMAPHRGSPWKWPKSCLKISDSQVILWEQPVEEPAFAHALRLWHTWRERLSRPDQRRLYRKSLEWSESALLFPGPRGESLGRVALHNALKRLLSGVGEGSRPDVSPQKIRAAFASRDPLTAKGDVAQRPDGASTL